MDILSAVFTLSLYCLVGVGSSLILLSVILCIVTSRYPIVERYEEENYFNDPIKKKKLKFPSINESYEVNLSVVVPAYNEEERLPAMLDETFEFLETRVKENPSYKYEIIVVSDGSKDNTVKVVETYMEKYGSEKIRCLELVKNRGKGGAVRLVRDLNEDINHLRIFYLDITKENFTGVQSARGATILFADADGASKFEDLTKLEASLRDLVKHSPITDPKSISDSIAIVIGSRAHLEKESLAKRNIFRNILMYGFHFIVWLFTVRGVRDTQCGFKLFTRRAARACFQSLHVNRWAFDVELLYIAQKLNIPISEIPVRWTEIEGSKVIPVLSWIQMGSDLGLIWLKYKIGAWKIKSEKVD